MLEWIATHPTWVGVFVGMWPGVLLGFGFASLLFQAREPDPEPNCNGCPLLDCFVDGTRKEA